MGTSCTKWLYQPKTICIILTLVNLLNYTDRGIVPGSTNEFDRFISKNLGTSQPDVYLGLLQSAFIVGFCIASIACGHAVHYYPPFFLCGVGLSVWCVAVLFSGISFYFESYTFLLIARMLSGCGEASFQCSVPPWIQSNLAESQAMWLSLFYTAIPVGTAVGYVYSALISESLGVKWAFIFEAIFMLPCVFYLFAVSPKYPTLTTHSEDIDIGIGGRNSSVNDATENLLTKDTLGDNYDRYEIDSVNSNSKNVKGKGKGKGKGKRKEGEGRKEGRGRKEGEGRKEGR